MSNMTLKLAYDFYCLFFIANYLASLPIFHKQVHFEEKAPTDVIYSSLCHVPACDL
jgi:hypothetical protein